MSDPTTFLYQFIFDQDDSNYTKIIQYFVMHGLGLCIKLNIYVEHMLYARSFIFSTEVTLSINQNIYYLSLNTHTAEFAWGAGN